MYKVQTRHHKDRMLYRVISRIFLVHMWMDFGILQMANMHFIFIHTAKIMVLEHYIILTCLLIIQMQYMVRLRKCLIRVLFCKQWDVNQLHQNCLQLMENWFLMI